MATPDDKIKRLDDMRSDAEQTIIAKRRQGKGNGGDDGGPPMSHLERRVENLEAGLASLREDVAVIKSNYSTREDVAGLRTEIHSSLRQQTMWSVGTIIAMAGLVFAIVRLLPPGGSG